MVTARYLGDKFLKPLQDKLREEGREEGREAGRAEAERLWLAWSERREAAYRNGLPFDEPPPVK